LIPPRKKLVTGHAYRTRANSAGFQFLLRVENQRNFGTARHQHYLWFSARRVSEHVSSVGQARCGSVNGAVNEGKLLSRQNESDGSVAVLERDTPRFGGLR